MIYTCDKKYGRWKIVWYFVHTHTPLRRHFFDNFLQQHITTLE